MTALKSTYNSLDIKLDFQNSQHTVIDKAKNNAVGKTN